MFSDPRDVVGRGTIRASASEVRATIEATVALTRRIGLRRWHAQSLLNHFARETGGFSTRQREIGIRAGRGGFGLMQWTAGRARALVAFSNEIGVGPLELSTQIRWLELELTDAPVARRLNGGTVWGNGAVNLSPREAKRRFWQATNEPTASYALLEGFIRPAEISQRQIRRAYRLFSRLEGNPTPLVSPNAGRTRERAGGSSRVAVARAASVRIDAIRDRLARTPAIRELVGPKGTPQTLAQAYLAWQQRVPASAAIIRAEGWPDLLGLLSKVQQEGKVADLQDVLRTNGFPIRRDGIIGKNTAAATLFVHSQGRKVVV